MSSERSRLLAIKHILSSGNYHELPTELAGLLSQNTNLLRFDSLIQAVNKKEYTLVEKIIEDLLYNNQAPVHSDDINLSGLRTNLLLLETKLSVLNYRKVEMQRVINEFRFLHNKYLGSLMVEIFSLRKDLLFLDLQENEDTREAYEEAKRDEDSFRKEHKRAHKQNVKSINRDVKAEMVALYRKASKMCHPDMIADELRQEATLLFIRLNEAYMHNDLEGIREVVRLLEQGGIHLAQRSEEIKEVDRVAAIIARLQSEIDSLQREIASIESSHVYLTITSEPDLSTYFAALKSKFEKERDHLKSQYESRTKPYTS